MMEAASTFGTSANFYQTTWCNNREDSHLYTRRRENLKTHKGDQLNLYQAYTLLLNHFHGNIIYIVEQPQLSFKLLAVAREVFLTPVFIK
jgi:hypothetical protein